MIPKIVQRLSERSCSNKKLERDDDATKGHPVSAHPIYLLHVAVPTHSHAGAAGASPCVQSQFTPEILARPRRRQRLKALSTAELQASVLVLDEAVAVST